MARCDEVEPTCAGTSRNQSCCLSPRASWLRCISRAARRPDSVSRLIHSLTEAYSTSMRSVSPLHSKIAPLPRKGQRGRAQACWRLCACDDELDIAVRGQALPETVSLVLHRTKRRGY